MAKVLLDFRNIIVMHRKELPGGSIIEKIKAQGRTQDGQEEPQPVDADLTYNEASTLAEILAEATTKLKEAGGVP